MMIVSNLKKFYKDVSFTFSMKKEIISLCRQIEKEHQIKILFAVESGSRLWRMDSKDSDYDVRFVFVQPLKNYISLNNGISTDLVINKMEGIIDLSGFDIFKFCKLFLQSNPSVIEWLQSDIIYYGSKPKMLKKIALTQFSPLALYHHYKSMCHFNYQKYLVSKREVTYKKYLYAIRGLINAKYVQEFKKLPPISFVSCLEKSEKIIPKNIIQDLKRIISLKKSGEEKNIVENSPMYDSYIEEFLKEDCVIIPKKVIDKDKINKEIQRIVLQND